ncbi:hypothetical protein ACFQ7N_32500 [Streptomyces niveus]|uniref:hypothetical protein n=1 Tax=Streptomyces niveus TaxID=193462 RepID=UPI00368A383D
MRPPLRLVQPTAPQLRDHTLLPEPLTPGIVDPTTNRKRKPVKPLLWFVLIAALATNIYASASVDDSATQIWVNVTSGVVFLASATTLFTLRRRT